jgi:hypothetical protein
VCDSGQCGRPLGATCQPGQIICIPNLDCNPNTLTCGPRDCTNLCAQGGKCEAHTCFDRLYCCNPSDIEFCVPDLLCECIVEGGQCPQP